MLIHGITPPGEKIGKMALTRRTPILLTTTDPRGGEFFWKTDTNPS